MINIQLMKPGFEKYTSTYVYDFQPYGLHHNIRFKIKLG